MTLNYHIYTALYSSFSCLYYNPNTVPPVFITKYNSRFSHLLVAVGDVADLIPREGALGCQPVVRLVDVQTQGVHSQKKICSLFILNRISTENKAFLLPVC